MPVETEKRRGHLQSRTLQRLLLATGSFLFMLFLIEFPAMINVIDYEGLEFSGIWGGLHFIRVADPELTHLEPPHAHHSGSSYGGDFAALYRIPASDKTLYRWNLSYDHNGFRNATDLKTADIAVIGDSMVEGMTVPDRQITTSVLARLQNKVVANLGQYGFGPPQELIVLKRYGLQLQPRTIVWMFTESNDLADSIGYREIARHPPTFWDFFLQRSFTRVVYRGVKRLLTPAKPLGVTRSGLMRSSNGDPLRMYFSSGAAGEALAGETAKAIDETGGVIATAYKLGAARKANFVFVFIPDKFRVFHDFCQFPQDSECRNWNVNNLPERMHRVVNSISPEIGYVDLTPKMIDAAKKGILSFYTDDIHLSPDGHRIAAESIDDYLRTAYK